MSSKESSRPWRIGGAVTLLALLALAPRTFGADRVEESWKAYAKKFVQRDGRVIDFAVPPGVTTSEGQVYALMRAVWMGDRDVFDRVLAWTSGNLAREGSPLPAWKWGKREDGTWGTLDVNTAADADVLLAFALSLAARTWNVPDLAERAQEIARAIWDEEVEQISGRWYLLPGKWARDYEPRPLNPSYYSPAILRRLERIDPTHPWSELATSTYSVLAASLPLTGLPSDWVSISTHDGTIHAGAVDGTLAGRFGHDAYRVYWNVALDYTWDRSEAAKGYLADNTWLPRFLSLNGTLPREVAADALPQIGGPEPLALHGSLLPGLALFHPEAAAKAREQLDAAYKDGIWGARADYYAQNLVWFGIALAEGRLAPDAPR